MRYCSVRSAFVTRSCGEMLEPRLDDDVSRNRLRLGDSSKIPRVGAIPAPLADEPLDCGEERFPVLGIDAYSTVTITDPDRFSSCPMTIGTGHDSRRREVDAQGGLQFHRRSTGLQAASGGRRK